MTFVLDARCLEPEVASRDVGDCYLVTADGAENPSCHIRLAPRWVTI